MQLTKDQKIKYGSFGAGGILIILSIVLSSVGLGSIGSTLFLAAIVCGALPYGFYIYFKQRKIENIEKNFPAFLRDLSESIKSGLTIPQAFQAASERTYGRLTPLIVKSANQISWGIPLPEVLERLAKKMEDSALIKRSLAVLLQSYNSGGNISKTIETISRDVLSIKEAEVQRKAMLSQQVVIIYVIYFVFVIIIIVLYKLGIEKMLGASLGSNGMFGANINMCSLSVAKPMCNLCPTFGFGNAANKLCYYKVLFLMMVLIQGIFNGLVGGQVGSGKISAGFKHSFIMATIGVLIYLLIV